MLAWAAPAASFPVIVGPATAVEYYNVQLGHYFLTADGPEVVDVDSGRAGPGWVRTGHGFAAHPFPLTAGTLCVSNCGVPVSRFYGTPGLCPNSHFYTANPVEAEILKQPGTGWSFEKIAFSIPAPDANGRCFGGLVPVFRLYNNRWMFNDSNHRFVADRAARARMLSLGWVDEGVAFCTEGAARLPLKSHLVSVPLREKILPSSVCEDEAANLGSCLALNNLAPPTVLLQPFIDVNDAPVEFFDRTGMRSSFNYVATPGAARAMAEDVFIQGAGSLLGIHVDTRNRGPAEFSSVNPLYQLRTAAPPPGATDERFFPWSGQYEGEVELAVSFVLNVKRIEVRAPGSHAFGHPTLEFIDRGSGRHLYFTALAYGTVVQADYLAPDVVTRKVIVGTTLRPDSPYVRNLGVASLHTPSGFVAENYWGWGGPFEFRMDLAGFQRVVDAARTIDPALSADPRDYLLDNFHFNNEVYGDGEIGVNLADFKLELLAR